MSLERSSFRRNFQRWVEANYGENSRTKTITQAKYNKICMYLLGQPGVDTDAKFRFWVKSKGFRITTAEDGQGYGNLFVPVKVPHTRSNEAMYPYDHQTGLRAQRIEYRRVAVAEEFFDVISAVHINERGIHVGQKKTYRAVASTYAFLPREAVSYYLMSCSTCKLRIQRCNSILLKHGRPVSPSLSYSDPESSDIDASMSSHESDEDMISFGNGRIKKEPDEVFNENIRANGVDSPSVDRDLSSLNGNHKEFTRDGLSEQLLFAKGIIPGYQTYSVDQKQEVVNYAKETTVREAARKYSVPRSTVQVWCKHGHSKREKRSPGEKGGGGGRRLSYSNETDEKLYQWVMKQQENGTPVTRDAIQQQARLLIRDECPDFKASSGWVEKFLTRHNLCIQTRMSSNNPLEAVPICYVVPQSQVVFPSPGTPSNNVNSPRADGRSVTSEDTRSDSGDDDDMDDTAMANLSVGQSIIREPPNLQEVLKPIKSLSSPAVAVKDDEDDEGEGEEGEIEKTEINVNPERLKAFNMFVRLFVDENLDRLVPISKQPKDKILAIIQSCQRQFPEFRDRARKRIRTYLKSCRRLKKLREPLKRTADQMSTNPNMSAAQMAQVNNILASACASEVENKRARTEPDNLTAPFSAVSPGPSPNIGMRPHSPAVPAPVGTPEKLSDGATAHKPKVLTQNQLNPSEITAIRHLIAGYRESAAFLYRSADELEALIPQSQ